MTTSSGFVVLASEGRKIAVPVAKSEITFKATADSTAGSVTLYESVLEPNAPGPARHFHRRLTEMIYVLEGEIKLQLGDDICRAPDGAFVFIPPGTVHAFSNSLNAPTKIMVIFSPGGFEKYFEEARDLPPSMSDPAWQSLNEKMDVVVVGPPLEN